MLQEEFYPAIEFPVQRDGRIARNDGVCLKSQLKRGETDTIAIQRSLPRDILGTSRFTVVVHPTSRFWLFRLPRFGVDGENSGVGDEATSHDLESLGLCPYISLWERESCFSSQGTCRDYCRSGMNGFLLHCHRREMLVGRAYGRRYQAAGLCQRY